MSISLIYHHNTDKTNDLHVCHGSNWDSSVCVERPCPGRVIGPTASFVCLGQVHSVQFLVYYTRIYLHTATNGKNMRSFIIKYCERNCILLDTDLARTLGDRFFLHGIQLLRSMGRKCRAQAIRYFIFEDGKKLLIL